MKVEEVIEYFECPYRAAECIGVTREAIRKWQTNKNIPNMAQLRIEKATDGGLKAEFKKSDELAIDIINGTYGDIVKANKKTGVPMINLCRWVVSNYIPVAHYNLFPDYFSPNKRSTKRK